MEITKNKDLYEAPLMIVVEVKQEGIHFTATIAGPSATKTTYTEDGTSINVVWKEGDQIALVHNGVIDVAEVKTVDGSGNATIEATITGTTTRCNGGSVRLVKDQGNL